jgi:hypothetical protein
MRGSYRGDVALGSQTGIRGKSMKRVKDRNGSQREKTDELLRNLGADDVIIETVSGRMEDEKVQSVIEKLRAFAQDNSAVVLGALSALIAGGAIAAGRAVVKKKSSKKSAKKGAKKSAKKRTLIEPHKGDKRFIRRDAKGRIKESVDVGRSLSADSRRKSKTRAKSGSGDKGDR